MGREQAAFERNNYVIKEILKDQDLIFLVNCCYAGRAYHNINHVEEVIANINIILDKDNLKNNFSKEEIHLLYFAAIFHDLIQNQKNDVEMSAKIAQSIFSRLFLYSKKETEYYSNELYKLIMATKSHNPHNLLAKILCDADMMILASNKKKYKEYKKGIRKEYSHINYIKFLIGRGLFLYSLLKRENIFHTLYGKSLEKSARKNIKRELFSL